MAIPTPLVEVGFDLTESPIGPFFALDDPVRGVLDNTDWLLAGTIFVDITSYARTIQISRGRSRDFSNYQSGAAVVELNNHNRYFDPLFEASPYNGNIIPRREIRISSGEEIQYTGWIDDWDLTYTPDGDSISTAIANDALGIFANQNLSASTPIVQKTGERIAAVLSDPTVAWAADLRSIDTGKATVGTQAIEADTTALTYLQNVANSEPGDFFIDKGGLATFRDRTKAPNSDNLVLFSKTEGIPFSNVNVIYGAELLYNEIIVGRSGGGTAIASNVASQGNYGIRSLAVTELLLNDDADLDEYALVWASRYSEPEYRFESIEIELSKITTDQQDSMLGLELGSIVRIQFEPNGIAPAIDRYIEVISINQRITSTEHYVTLGFQGLDYQALILDDSVFGKLDIAALSW
jgi:hypothetical protein